MRQRHQKRLGRRGQSTVEYAVLLAIIISAFIAMQYYVKRAWMGRARTVTDQQIGRQWDPFAASGKSSVTTSTHQKQLLDTKGHSTTELTAAEKSNREANQETVAAITNKHLF